MRKKRERTVGGDQDRNGVAKIEDKEEEGRRREMGEKL